jgi:hypothetical protein
MIHTVPEGCKRRPLRQDLSRIAPAAETALAPDALHAHPTSGGLPQSPRSVPAPR